MPESGSSGGKESVEEKEVYEFGHTVNSIPERESTKKGHKHLRLHLTLQKSKRYLGWYNNIIPHCSYHHTYFLLSRSHPHLSLIFYEYPFPTPKIQNRNPTLRIPPVRPSSLLQRLTWKSHQFLCHLLRLLQQMSMKYKKSTR